MPLDKEIEIKPASVFVASWVAANMRDIDKDEIHCQMADPRPGMIAHTQLSLSPRFAYQALIKGEPVMVYGLAEWQPGIGHLWAYGTRRMYGALKKVTDHIKRDIYGEVFADSKIHRVECRSIETHVSAHRWIETIGLHFVTDLPCYGKDAENFKLYALTRNEVGYVQHASSATRSGTTNSKRRRTKAKKSGRRKAKGSRRR